MTLFVKPFTFLPNGIIVKTYFVHVPVQGHQNRSGRSGDCWTNSFFSTATRSMHVSEMRAAEALASSSSRGTDAQQIILFARCMHVYKGQSSPPDQYRVASDAPAIHEHKYTYFSTSKKLCLCIIYLLAVANLHTMYVSLSVGIFKWI